MLDIVESLMHWWTGGTTFALATVVDTWNSSPRLPGATMAVSECGEVLGSVSGGCVEGALYEVAKEVLAHGQPQVVRYGVSDDDAFTVGLTCGGTLEVNVVRVSRDDFPDFEFILQAIADQRPIVLATVINGLEAGRHLVVTPETFHGTLGDQERDRAVAQLARGMLARCNTSSILLDRDGTHRSAEMKVFFHCFAVPPRMIVFGAIDYAAAVARIGKFLGYRVSVCDARSVFATRHRFPDADEVVVDWPHRYLAETSVDSSTVLCVLTHDPKFDIPLLKSAVQTEAAYIGVMGSRRTHLTRMQRLRDEGLSEEQLARISSPIGLDLGARTPEETAVAVAAEIVALRWGGTGQRLTDLVGPIHRNPADATPSSAGD